MKESVDNTGWRPTRRSVLLTACALWMASTPHAALAETPLMDDQLHHDFGKLSPHAPAELARFAFLIGSWRGEAKIASANGEWQAYQVTWLGRFILDGYAIADEYRMTDSSGKLVV